MPDGRKASAPQHSVDGIFEKRAFGVLEEAIALGILPCFKTGKETVDLQGMPPNVAAVYVLEVLASLAEKSENRFVQPMLIDHYDTDVMHTTRPNVSV